MTVETRPATPLAASVERAVAIAERHAAEADATRTLAPEVLDALREAGFSRHFVGTRWGGRDGSFTDLTRAVMALGAVCPSTAWTASLCAYSSRYAAHLPEEGHRELWSAGPDAFVVTGLVAAGRAHAVDGGWRLSGRWNYVSGIEFADWAVLCATATKGDHNEPRFFALARGSFQILRTWDNAGMRATGSHSALVEDVFVPDHLTYPRSDMMHGTNAASNAHCHTVPFQAVGGLTFAAPAVGAATGALRACAALLGHKRRTVSSDIELVRASGAVDVSRHLVEQNAEVLDTRAFTPAMMARNERNATYAAEQLSDAISNLVRATGTSGLSESAPVHRFWRDVIGITSHVALRYETAVVRTYPPVLFGEH